MELSFDVLKNVIKMELNKVLYRWETGGWRHDLDKTMLHVHINKVGISYM